jgi:phytoene synthase
VSALPLRKHDWEAELLSAARLPFTGAFASPSDHHAFDDHHDLDAAYRHCEAVTREHSRTFFMASSLLPAEKRQAVRALYAFCRTTDDIVDQPQTAASERSAALDEWRVALETHCNPQQSPVTVAWRQTQARFQIPSIYSQQLIEGCARDLTQTRYHTFPDLAAYAYGVASTVGLMAMHIIGFKNEDALPYAVRLGVALQLTNILRDVGTDWQNGRLYLPQQELAEFGLSEADVAAGRVTDRWRAFMAFQIERNRHLYDEALPGIALLDPDGRLAIGAAASLYRAILKDIENHDYDVFNRRAHVSTLGKLLRIPGVWWYSRTVSLH